MDSRVPVIRTHERLLPNARRVLARPHSAALRQVFPDGRRPVRPAMERILSIPDEDVTHLLSRVMEGFTRRHHDLEHILEEHFQTVAGELGTHHTLSRDRRLLIGAYFTLEYAVESTALFNPSIVRAPDQSHLPPGACRFILSLRAVGEGHISSIEFRSGVIDGNGNIVVDAPTPYLRVGHRAAAMFSKPHICSHAAQLGADDEICSQIMEMLPDRFRMDQLEAAISQIQEKGIGAALAFETVRIIHLVAASNYEVVFPPDSTISERVLVPAGPRETQGMEDARFVRFIDDDGSVTYYATYTAFDGFGILPQLIETKDFARFRIATLSGRFVRNKGMAIFPRRIGGRYASLSRHDQESVHVMFSDDVRTWEESEAVLHPRLPWGMIQLGNCGSPIETPEGWIILTHGVGPMRRYSIGAALLDLEDPTRVIGELPFPLLEPDESEREGYVPNVVYSCGAMVHGPYLVLPYGFSDHGTSLALVPLDELLASLRRHES